MVVVDGVFDMGLYGLWYSVVIYLLEGGVDLWVV